MNKSLHLPLLALCITAMISACGGGGGDSDPAPVTSINATLQGKAAKGIIIGGKVVANELNSDGTVKNANVGSATTDATGSYSLSTNTSYKGGPIELTITADSNTLMVCDATSGCGSTSDTTLDLNSNNTVDFGEKYKPSSLSMTALLPDAGNGDTIAIQITPFTHMAARRARSQGSLSKTTIEQSNSAVSNMVGGISILRTEPVDITDSDSMSDASPTSKAYAALSASVAELADNTSSGEPDLDQILSRLTNDFSDGSISATLLGDIVTGAGSALSQASTSDTSGVLVAMQNDVTDAGTGDVTPTPSDTSGNSDIEKATAFISDLRTWGTVINNEIDSPSQAFQTQMDLSNEAYNALQGSTSDAINAAFNAMSNIFDGTETSTDLSQHSVYGGSFSAGTITKTQGSGSFDVYTVSNATFVADSSPGDPATINMVIHAPVDGTSVGPGDVTFGIQSLTASDTLATISVTTGSITMNLGTAYSIDSTALDPPAPDITSITFALQATLTEKLTSDGSGGFITAVDPITFTGDIGFTVYPYQDTNGEILDGVPGSFQLTGTVTNTSGDSVDMSFTGTLTNAASITPTNTVLAMDSTYASNNDTTNVGTEDLHEHLAYWDYTGNSVVAVSPSGGVQATFNSDTSITAQFTDSSGWTNNYTFPSPSGYTSITDWFVAFMASSVYDYWSTHIAGQGTYESVFSSAPYDFSIDGYVTFTLSEPEVNYNIDAEPLDVGLQFTAQLNGLPEASVSITGKQTALDTGNAKVTISYGTRSIVFDGSFKPASDPQFSDGTATLTITNSDGVKLVMSANVNGGTNGDTLSAGTVTIDGKQIATLEETSNGNIKVNYIDGTFEIF